MKTSVEMDDPLDPKDDEDEVKPEETNGGLNGHGSEVPMEVEEPSAFKAKVQTSRHHDDEIELNIEDASAMNTTDVVKISAFSLPIGIVIPEDIDALLFTPMIQGLTTEISDFYTSHVKMLKLKNVLREMTALEQTEPALPF
jgi:hypothetical protein